MPGFFADRILSGTQQGTAHPGVYRVEISGSARGREGSGRLQVLAQTPEEIGIQIDNEWDAYIANGEIPLPIGRSGGALGAGTTLAEFGARATGLTRSNQGLTSQVWRGTSPLEIQLPLLLNARENAYQDVVVPIKNLIQLASPFRIGAGSVLGEYSSIFGNIIHAPGPTILDVIQGSGRGNISLTIGRLLSIPSVVITSLQFDIKNRMTRQGYPVEADVNVVLRTHYTYLREDYDAIFGFDR